MDIPAYPARRSLGLADRPMLQELFRQLQPEVSELSFANLYLFRRAHRYHLSLVEGNPVILGTGYGGEPYVLPPLGGDRVEAARLLLAAGETIYGADERLIADLGHDDRLVISSDRSNFDYLYLRDDLARLPGNRFHKKKNRINYFTARHAYRVEPFCPRHLCGAIRLLEEWQRVRSSGTGGSLSQETEATREGLELAEVLELSGIVVMVDNDVAAFALGERLNGDTAVCHFEKADPFTEGVAQLVNREFSSRLFPDCTYINREQDLGEPGLREAKLSYHPVRLVRKFRIAAG